MKGLASHTSECQGHAPLFSPEAWREWGSSLIGGRAGEFPGAYEMTTRLLLLDSRAYVHRQRGHRNEPGGEL